MVPYRCATKRLCGKCWGDELSILAHAQYDYRHLFARGPEERKHWDDLHATRTDMKAQYDRRREEIVSKLAAEIGGGRMTQEEASARIKHWEIFNAPPLCS